MTYIQAIERLYHFSRATRVLVADGFYVSQLLSSILGELDLLFP